MAEICRQILDRAQEFRVLGKEGAAEEMLKAADAYFRAEIPAGRENAAGVVDRIALMLPQDLLSDVYPEEMPGDFVPIPNSYAEEMAELSNEEYGALCRALILYS